MNRPYNSALPRIARTAALGAAVAVGGFACDAKQPLVVKDPDVATPITATGPAALPLLRAGMLADFAVAVVGAADQANNAHEGIVNFGAIFTDEFEDEDTFPTRSVMNTRDATNTNSSLGGVFQNMGAAHNDAVRALAQYATFGATQIGRAEMYNVDAYAYIYTAEHWCSGVPFSTINIATGQVTNGAFLTTAQMLDTAVAELQAGKAVALSDTVSADISGGAVAQQVGLSLVGTARALLDLGQVTAAADTAATVATGFTYSIFESVNTPRQESGIWNYTAQSQTQAFSVADKKNGTGLPFISSPDPRVPFVLSPNPANNGNPTFFNQQKYPVASSGMVVADFTEAQLIVAEGDVFSGNYPAAFAIMNGLRTASGLSFSTPLANLGASTPKAQMQQILTERAYWMYVTGHRLGDWRRVLRAPYTAAPFSFVPGDVYPFGTGISTTLEFPTPLTTNPNPNYVACDPTQP
jgi:starch-binding outer membrane protein, SusD/RagB family